jgi:uncharacterized protein YggE
VLAAAFNRAKARATTLATQAGSTLGSVLAIDEGEGPTFALEDGNSKGYAGAHAGAPTPVRPGSSTVTATVHVVFFLQ